MSDTQHQMSIFEVLGNVHLSVLPHWRLNEQVKRNIGRFPERYMFQLTIDEHLSLRSQNATLKRGQHSKYAPFAFTEHGVLMLSSVLKSERAEKVNLLIIDTFVELNQMLYSHKDLLLKMEELSQLRLKNKYQRIKNK